MQLTEPPRYWNYFQGLFDICVTSNYLAEISTGKGILTHEKFPDDLDTTSLGLVTLKPPKEHCNSLMDEMLTLLTEDGLPYVSHHGRLLTERYLHTHFVARRRRTSTGTCRVWTP